MINNPTVSRGIRRLLVVDTSYTLSTLRQREQLSTIICRDLDGFFDHVYTVHPLVGADASEDDATATGPIRKERLSERHTVIENPVRSRGIGRLIPPATFLFNQLSVLRFLRHLIRKEHITAIRIGDPHYQGLLGLWLARRNRIPLIIRIGGNLDAIYEQTGTLAYPKILPTKRIEKAVERFVLKRADLVVGANQDNLEYAIRNGADRERTAIFRYGNLVTPVHFTEPGAREGGPLALESLGTDPTAPILVFVGRLQPVKHVQDLIAMHARVVERHPSTQLLIIGDGSERTAMEEKANEHGTQDRVYFAGDRDQNWIAKVVPHTSVIVATHMGRALVETTLGGVPVVAYDHDWHGELVQDGKNGRLVPFGDIDGFADAVAGLLDDPHMAAEMGQEARKKAYDMMHPDRLNAHERATYERLLTPRTEVLAKNRPTEAIRA